MDYIKKAEARQNYWVTGLKFQADAAFDDNLKKQSAEYWVRAYTDFKDDFRFSHYAIMACLNVNAFEQAETILEESLIDFQKDNQPDLLEDCRKKLGALRCAHYRVMGHKAFDAHAFNDALQYFTLLNRYDPEHPYAAKYFVKCQGLASSFGDRLKANDAELKVPKTRILITGCGRSGTWLLAAMMGCFDDVAFIPQESPVGLFADMHHVQSTHLVKRQHDTHKYFNYIHQSINVLHIVRHPYDVLTSRHLNQDRFITPENYRLEMEAWIRHISGRPGAITIRYEDLVTGPNIVQKKIAQQYNLNAVSPFADFYKDNNFDTVTLKSMHGLRPVSKESIGRWKKNKDDRDFLKTLSTPMADIFDCIATRFGYDMEIE